MTLPDKTMEKVKKMAKRYGKRSWEIVVMAVEREWQTMQVVEGIIAEGEAKDAKEARGTGGASRR